MSLFLFLKQIVDILYPYHWLDYAMVIMAVIALVYQVLLVRPKLKGSVTLTDIGILLLGILVSVQFLLSVDSSYGVYVKILSALLMFFVGRIYYERIQECEDALAYSSYIVIYANLMKRIITFGIHFLEVRNAEGDLYYNDTDMAYAMLMALILIAMYARNSIFKLITMFVIVPYLVLCSDAGVQKVLFFAIFVLLFVYCLEKLGVPRKASNVILSTAIVGLFGLIGAMLLPVFTGKNNAILQMFQGGWINASSMESRFSAWVDVWKQIREANLWQQLFGLGLENQINISNQYLRILYASGFVGALIVALISIGMLYRIVKVEDRKTYYTALLFSIVFLGTSILVNCMEFTQMSWFLLMYLGMVVSASRQPVIEN